MRFTAAVVQEGDLYVANCLEVRVTSQGPTVDAALSNLREALELYFEDEPELVAAAASLTPALIKPIDIAV